ncbi:MAG TPA: hypothetical protein VJZ71_18520 [Phycisphaerae bacterium]|nr:hypothetical protein [Phycisphaerae bacterium]
MIHLKSSTAFGGVVAVLVGGMIGGCVDAGAFSDALAPRTGADRPLNLTSTKEELHDKLDQFEDLFEAVLAQAGDDLVRAENTRRVKRLVLIWQMRMVPMMRDALSQDNALGGFLDSWTLCVRMRQFLTEGEGRGLFGKNQAIATKAALHCETEIENIGRTVLSRDVLASARNRVQAVAKEHPLRGEFSGGEVRAALQTGEQDKVLQTILEAPLTPFRWLGGVDEGAQAIKGFTVVASRLTDVVQGLAADARLQTQLLLLETEDLDTVKSTVASLDRASKSADRLATSAERLTGGLEEPGPMHEEVRKTVGETRELVDALKPAGQSVATAGDAWAGTARAIQEMVASFRTPAPGQPKPATQPSVKKETPPYDINDYRRTAEALTQTAKELQVLIADLRGLTESDRVTQRLEEMSKSFDNVLSESTDRATWRAIQVAIIVLGLAIAYRVVAVRYIRPRAS